MRFDGMKPENIVNAFLKDVQILFVRVNGIFYNSKPYKEMRKGNKINTIKFPYITKIYSINEHNQEYFYSLHFISKDFFLSHKCYIMLYTSAHLNVFGKITKCIILYKKSFYGEDEVRIIQMHAIDRFMERNNLNSREDAVKTLVQSDREMVKKRPYKGDDRCVVIRYEDFDGEFRGINYGNYIFCNTFYSDNMLKKEESDRTFCKLNERFMLKQRIRDVI